MIILLDTNAFIWWVADDPRLGRRARADIANPDHNIYLSNVSLFECAIKSKLGKLRIDFDAVDQEISEGRLRTLPFDSLVARQLVNQPNMPQSDPFDAAIVAQAIAKRMTLITSDRRILDLSIVGLRLLDAKK